MLWVRDRRRGAWHQALHRGEKTCSSAGARGDAVSDDSPYIIDRADSVPNFVYASWLQSEWKCRLYSALQGAVGLSKTEWMRRSHDRIEALSRRPGWLLLTLTNRDAPGWLGGYVAAERTHDACVVYWALVKPGKDPDTGEPAWRRKGHARAMVQAALLHTGHTKLVAGTYHPKWTPRLQRRGIETDLRVGRVE